MKTLHIKFLGFVFLSVIISGCSFWAFFSLHTSRAEALQGVDQPSCIDNYESWSSSQEYNPDAEWSLSFMPYEGIGEAEQRREYFLDIDGNGSPDYIYARNWNNNASFYSQECVMLNNDAGWETVYKCVARPVQAPNGNHIPTYYGDCALTE